MKYIDVASFVDDLIIPEETFEIHLIKLEKVLQKLNEFGFTLKARKCSFAMDKTLFLGHIFSNKGITPSPAINDIDKLKIPANISGPICDRTYVLPKKMYSKLFFEY
jgi:hypothetical protein